MTLPFVDTSALAKLYVSEPDSDAFETWFAEAMPVTISLLTTVELSSVLQKYVRMGRLSPALVQEMEAAVGEDIVLGCVRVADVPSGVFHLAKSLIAANGALGLRSLDAIQLASALTSGTTLFVTSDAALAEIASANGLQVRVFSAKT